MKIQIIAMYEIYMQESSEGRVDKQIQERSPPGFEQIRNLIKYLRNDNKFRKNEAILAYQYGCKVFPTRTLVVYASNIGAMSLFLGTTRVI